MKSPIHSVLGASCALALTAASASATIIYSSDGSSLSGYAAFSGATSLGTVASTLPFSISGVSQGSYISATNYPFTSLPTSVTASTTPDIWVAFLMRDDSGNAWAGGITLFDSTSSKVAAVTIGWNNKTEKIGLNDGGSVGGNPSAQNYSLVGLDGTQVAVLAHIYENGTSGKYDRADLYVDGNLADGISFTSPIVTGYTINNSDATIGALRLEANTASGGEIRSYDNIAVTTTQQEALNLISAVPEPGSAAALLGGCGVLLGLRRRRG
jgi:hypothetical protein